MFDALKRWIAGETPKAERGDVVDWARQRGARFKRAREDEGFVVDAQLDGRPWRLEWGPPQRDYIEGRELRLRMELGLSHDLQMLLLARPLLETLEKRTFEHYTATMQTQIDLNMPEEMRWLAMFPKVPLTADREFKSRFAAVAASPVAAAAWIDGPVAECLAELSRGVLAAEPPLVLMTLRGRAYLRMQAGAADVATLDGMARLFETAVAQAVRVNGSLHERVDAWPSTASTAWQTQLQPEDVGTK